MNDELTRNRGRGEPRLPHTLTESDYRLLATVIPQLVWAVGADGRLQYLSSQWSDYTGITPEELQRIDRESLVHEADLPRVRDAWERSLATGAPHELRYRMRHASGEWRWQLARGVPIRDVGGGVVRWVGTLTDIHDQVLAEEELLAARNEAERLRCVAEAANRMKDDFLSVVSHELRAPLNAIGGWAGVLRLGRLDAAGIEKAATIIEKNVRAQAKMIEDLLDVSRIASGKFRFERRAFDPVVAVEGAVEALRPTADTKGVRLALAKSAQPATILGDPSRLQQAVWNLVSNAVKFTEGGGEICVTLARRDGVAEVEVRDTGAGITADLLPQLFERFRQGSGTSPRRFGGLGLGLAMVRHIVELHGGEVEARSDGEGHGATFVIRIPLANERREASTAAGARPERAGHAAAPGSLAGLRLLSVDDEPDASEVLKAALEHYGAHVTTVASGAAALELLERDRFDVLVSDIGMPGMNGYELLERIRNGTERVREIPAIAVTGFAREEDRARALQAGYRAHVVKPIEPDELAVTVRAAARSRRPTTQARPS
ncbi:MAG TPA: ATP-binding protein [Steroidobacteraceae bacterium]|nr:ATP-binding protein [Steroidobacteraceae bacterium]